MNNATKAGAGIALIGAAAVGFMAIGIGGGDINLDHFEISSGSGGTGGATADVDSADATITCIATITEGTGGTGGADSVRDFSCTIAAPTGSPRGCTAHSGVAGVWSCDVTIPRYAEAGTYSLDHITIRDMLFTPTSVSYTNAELVADGVDGGVPSAASLDVEVTSTTPDTAGPEIGLITAFPALVDPGDTVTITIQATDTISVVADRGATFVSATDGTLACTAHGATETCTVVVPPTADAGVTWLEVSHTARDTLGNLTQEYDAQSFGTHPAGGASGAGGTGGTPAGFPSLATTGITDYWCPRWSTLKTDTTSDVTVSTTTPYEYGLVTGSSSNVNITAANATMRCVHIDTGNTSGQLDTNTSNGMLVEDVHISTSGGTTATMVDIGRADGFTMRRTKIWPLGCDDAIKPHGILLQDSYLDATDAGHLTSCGSAHIDVIQTGGCDNAGHFYVHNTLLGDYQCGGNESDPPEGIPGTCTNGSIFFSNWETTCGNSPSMTVVDNFMSGSLVTSRLSDQGGQTQLFRYLDNTLVEGAFKNGICDHLDTDSYSHPPHCFEYEGNVTDQGQALEDYASSCEPSKSVARDVCSSIPDTPITTVSSFNLGSTSCTEGQAACNDITLSASATDNVSGNSLRWRYNCGGTTAQTLSPSPCTAGHCLGGYQDDKADLWYDYPGCDGLSSCTMTDVCDYQSETDGVYTAKIYADSGPGGIHRPTDHDEATFTVNPGTGGAPAGFPSLATTGITDYWCPRFEALKSTETSIQYIWNNDPVMEYVEIVDADLGVEGDFATGRCLKISREVGSKIWMETGKYYNTGALLEDVEAIAIDTPSTSGDMIRHDAYGGAVRRAKVYPASGDCFKTAGLLIQDSYCDIRNNLSKGGDPHADGVQSSGGCGDHWLIHNTFLTDYIGTGDPDGWKSNSATFFVSRWSFSPCPQIRSLVIDSNYLSGGVFTDRHGSYSVAPHDAYWIENTRTVDNVFETDAFATNYCANDFPFSEAKGACYEFEDNFTDLGVNMDALGGCVVSGMVGRDGCGSGIVATPTTTISGFSGDSCSKALVDCDDITLSANATTNQTGGSMRWRYNCGGTAGNTDAVPCSRETCAYEDDGADLWYHYGPCDGLTSCTMTSVCDFQSENTGTYTMKVYAETGPGADYRPSDHDEATFTVNP